MNNRYFWARYLTSDGKEVERLFFLPTPQDVRREIHALHGVTQSISERRTSWINREFYSRDYKLAFLKGLSFHLDVGVSAGQALIQVIEAETHPRKRAEMQPALEVLAQGGRFGDAIAMLPFIHRHLAVLLQAGDAAGTPQEAIADAVSLVESQNVAWKMLAGAFLWLSLDLFTVISTVFAIHFYAVPWFHQNPPPLQGGGQLEEYNSQLAAITSASQWMLWGTVALGAAVVALVALLLWGSAPIKERLYGHVIRLPALRGVFIDGALADGFMLLSRMIKNGVPTLRALELLQTFSWVYSVSAFWRAARLSLNAGWDTRQAFADGGLLTPQELVVLSMHQSSAHLARIMESMSYRRRGDAEAGTKRFIRTTVAATVVYMGLVASLAIWLVSLQNIGLTGSFESLMKGAF